MTAAIDTLMQVLLVVAYFAIGEALIVSLALIAATIWDMVFNE